MIHSELTKSRSGRRKIKVTPPNINTASLDLSKTDKPRHVPTPNIGHGSMTTSEPQMDHLGNESEA
jgi:hypothetical protein